MDTPEKSRQLAETMVRIGSLSGKKFSAVITDMNQPLGNYIGNALEVEAVSYTHLDVYKRQRGVCPRAR